MGPASTLMALLPLVWLLLGAGTAASMNLTMTTPSQPRCFAGEIGGGVCEVKVYTACQTQSGEPDADKRKLKATRGMGDDDEPEPFPIPAPGVGKQQLFESGIPTDSIVTRHFAIGECAQRVSEAYHRNSIQYRGTKPLTDSVLNEYPVWVVKGRAYNLGTPRSVRGHCE